MDGNAINFDRLPPHSVEAEMCAVASAALDPDILRRMRSIIDGSDYYQADHGIAWRVLCEMQDAGKPVDAVMLRAELDKRGLLAEVGGTAYLGQMLNTVPSSAHGEHYAQIVREKSDLRELIASANEVLRRAYAPTESVEPAADIGRAAAARVAAMMTRQKSMEMHTSRDVALEVLDQTMNGGVSIIPTFFSAIDNGGGGVARGETMIIAARPSMGKSMLAKCIARRQGQHGVRVGYITPEESRQKVMRNWIAGESQIHNRRVRQAKDLSAAEYASLTASAQRMAELPVIFNDRARSISQVVEVATAMRAEHQIDVLIIDHLGQIRGRGNTAYDRINNACESLVDCIKELGVAGIVLHQLNRNLTQRDDKRPTMADLRDSGRIEELADIICLLHREDYYHLEDTAYIPSGLADLIWAKFRDGARGGVTKLKSNLPWQRFEDATAADAVPEFT